MICLQIHGCIEEAKLLRKGGMRPGDRLILTKALGTGALFAADMRGQCAGMHVDAAVASMLHSNRASADILQQAGATAATDVTGFGLLGREEIKSCHSLVSKCHPKRLHGQSAIIR